MKNYLFLFVLAFSMLVSCGGGSDSPKKGSDLKGGDAIDLLAGDEKKAWKLVSGHSIYDLLMFDANGGAVVFAMDPPVPYMVSGNKLVITEETGYKAVFTIKQISADTLIMERSIEPEAVGVMEPLVYMNLETYRSKGIKQPEDFFLKGEKGTAWKDLDKKYAFSFMNDGKLIHGPTGKEAGTWSLEKNADSSKGIYQVEILASDYVKFHWGDTLVDLHYAGEAK
ncbi:MAG: hypothetical protein ACHQF2_00485 [Flavobacteriales bacterium]